MISKDLIVRLCIEEDNRVPKWLVSAFAKANVIEHNGKAPRAKWTCPRSNQREAFPRESLLENASYMVRKATNLLLADFLRRRLHRWIWSMMLPGWVEHKPSLLWFTKPSWAKFKRVKYWLWSYSACLLQHGLILSPLASQWGEDLHGELCIICCWGTRQGGSKDGL